MLSIKDVIFTPADLAKQHVLYAKKIHAEPGVTWGIPSVDNVVLPIRGGETAVILGRPGDGKSSIMCYLAMHQARVITNSNDANRVVVYITWESTVDKLYTAIMSSYQTYTSTELYHDRVPIEIVEQTAEHYGARLPIIFIGFSSFRKSGYKQITLDVVLEAIEAIQEGYGLEPKKVDLVCADYLQLIPIPGASGRTETTSEAMIQFHDLGMRLDIPTICGAQAGRQVDSYDVKLALPGDAQHSSIIEQHVDQGWSIWRPWRTEPHPLPNTIQELSVFGRRIRLHQNLLIIKNWKQRGDDTGNWWPLYLRPEIIQLAELEERGEQ